jgi:2-polyprenyl-3-methyl-5-hydroxy-6-metoxy-1,4-benzoquinol methylase
LAQLKEDAWCKQWEMFKDDELFLFKEWIFPNTLEDFRGKEVLECGCGGGQHTSFVAPYVKHITAVDLNTVNIAIQRNQKLNNIEFMEADIANMDIGKAFDIVFSIGVVHHTDNPYKTFENLKKHVKPGGKLILWVYSEEGNFMVKNIVEPVRKSLLCRMNKKMLLKLSKALTILMYIPIYSLYLLPLRFLPYYEYFGNFRRLSFNRNHLNVFDKLNAPQVIFINRTEIDRWFNKADFKDVQISNYKKVSWRASGVRNG